MQLNRIILEDTELSEVLIPEVVCLAISFCYWIVEERIYSEHKL